MSKVASTCMYIYIYRYWVRHTDCACLYLLTSQCIIYNNNNNLYQHTNIRFITFAIRDQGQHQSNTSSSCPIHLRWSSSTTATPCPITCSSIKWTMKTGTEHGSVVTLWLIEALLCSVWLHVGCCFGLHDVIGCCSYCMVCQTSWALTWHKAITFPAFLALMSVACWEMSPWA